MHGLMLCGITEVTEILIWPGYIIDVSIAGAYPFGVSVNSRKKSVDPSIPVNVLNPAWNDPISEIISGTFNPGIVLHSHRSPSQN